MKSKILPILVTSIFLILFILFYKGLKNSNIYVPRLIDNNEIPYFKADLFDKSKKMSSDEIFQDENFYLMNIWSSWCVPCRDEHVFLKDLAEEKNLILIGLNYKDNLKSAKSFLSELGNPYNNIFLDQNGLIAIDWGAYGVPETYLIKKKKIIKKVIGPLSRDMVLEIKDLIK